MSSESLPSAASIGCSEVISLVLGSLLPERDSSDFFFWRRKLGVTRIRSWMGDDFSLNISLNWMAFCRLGSCSMSTAGVWLRDGQGRGGGDLKDSRWWLILILAYLTL